MPAEKANAIVLRVVEWSETSSIVTLFTREFGKVSGAAKGARRLKGPFESALDLLAQCRVVFLRKSSDALNILTEAKLERRFRPRSRDLASLYAAYYVAELLGALTHDDDPHPEVYDIAVATLAGLGVDGAGPVPNWVLRFELLALGHLGHLPSLATCVGCGAEVEPAGRVPFGLIDGGVFCPDCRHGKTQVVSVRAGVIALLSQFADAASEHWRTLEPDGRLLGELRGLMNRYVEHLLGHRPAMQRYLRILSE